MLITISPRLWNSVPSGLEALALTLTKTLNTEQDMQGLRDPDYHVPNSTNSSIRTVNSVIFLLWFSAECVCAGLRVL